MACCALTIAGSDPTGGAGIQADLKTFAALGVYGLSVLTCLTAQNSSGVQGVHAVPAVFVCAQIESLIKDFQISAIKIGMVYQKDTIKGLSGLIRAHLLKNPVLDPIVSASSGGSLIQEEGLDALKEELLPISYMVTPNIPEAELLAGMDIKGLEEMKAAAHRIHIMGPKYVLIKGGHLKGRISDLFYDGNGYTVKSIDRHPNETRGTGCTLSAAITAGLAKGLPVSEAVSNAQEYTQSVILEGLSLGKGPLYPNHLKNLA